MQQPSMASALSALLPLDEDRAQEFVAKTFQVNSEGIIAQAEVYQQQLKAYLRQRGVPHADCFEKRDLLERARTA